VIKKTKDMFKYMICLFFVATLLKADPISVNEVKNPLDNYSNSTSFVNDDVVKVIVENSGELSVMTTFSLYLDENTELTSFKADKSKRNNNKMQEYVLEPTVFTDDLFNEENEVAWTKMRVPKDEQESFEFSYSAVGGNPEKKKMNKFLSELVLDTEDPQQVNVIISSANFNLTSYPSNSKHLWIVRCHPDYKFNIQFTQFDIEAEFDGIALFDITEGSRRLVLDVTGLETVETNTNNLLIKFKSDCDVTMSGFRAVVSAVKRNDVQETTSSVATTDVSETTQSTTENNHQETTTYFPEPRTQYETDRMTTISNEQTTSSILGTTQTCKNIKDSDPSAVSGKYQVEIQGEIIELFCEMAVTGGGWAVFHNRYEGSTDFARNWTSYENGFGQLDKEFWLGLKNIHKLTSVGSVDLRIEMSSFDGRNKYAEYKEFKVSDASNNYRMSFKEWSYSGDNYDALWYHNNMQFSSYDVDNDGSSGNCATMCGYGGNWYNQCHRQNMNGQYGADGDAGFEYMYWWDFDTSNYYMALKSMRWMVREVV